MTTVTRSLPKAAPRPLALRRPKAITGFWSWFTTVDHKKIGILYGGTAHGLLRRSVASRRCSSACSSRVPTARCSPPRSTTPCSPCTAPPWCSWWACRWRSRSATTSSRCRSVRATSRSRASTCSGTGSSSSVACSSTRASSSAARRTAVGSATRRSRARRSPVAHCPGQGPNFWCVGIVLLGIGSTTSAINFIVTVLNMRAPGMTLMRMPVFTWMMTVVAFLTVFAMPIITAAMIMVFFDRNYDTLFFVASKGGDPLLYQHLFWLFGHPEVYILILPGMGIVSEVLPDVQPQAAVRLLGGGLLRHRHRLHGLGRVGAPHVRHRTRAGRHLRLRLVDDAHRHPHRREDLQLDGHRLRRRGASSPPRCCSRWASSRCSPSADCRACSTRSSPPTRSRPTPTSWSRTSTTCCSAVCSSAIFAGFYYWWPKVFGRMLNETLGQVELLADAHRVQPHVLPDAHPRPHRHAPPHLPLPERHGVGHDEPDRDDRRVRHRRVRAHPVREHDLLDPAR